MNTNKNEKPNLRDILNEFVMSAQQPTPEMLDHWIREFPQYERELLDFAAAWVAEDILVEPPAMAAEDENLILTRAMSQIENLFYQQDKKAGRAAAANGTPIISLVRSAKDVGLNAAAFADECRLDLILVTKVEGRHIKSETIPQILITRFGEVLHRTVADIMAFLAQPPRIIAGTSFLSHGTPQARSQESFEEAVSNSGLTPELKDYWLNETRNNGPPGQGR